MYFRSRVMIGIMCVCATAALLSGCGQTETSEAKDIVKAEETSSDTAASKEEVDEPQEEKEAAVEDSGPTEITIEEQVLVEQDGIRITALEYVKDSIWGDGIKVLIENDSEKDVMVGCDALIVNDYMIHDLFGSEIARELTLSDGSRFISMCMIQTAMIRSSILTVLRSRRRRLTRLIRPRMMRELNFIMKVASGSSVKQLTRAAFGEQQFFCILRMNPAAT